MEVRQDLTLSSLRVDPLSVNGAVDALTVEGPVTMTKTLAVTGAVTCSSTLTGAKVNIVATTTTLTVAQSGSYLIPTAGSAQTFTLPAVASSSGVKYHFIAGSAQAHVITSAAADVVGYVYDNTDGTTLAVTDVAGTSITLVDPTIGDSLTIVCNGANWFVEGRLNNTPTVA